MRSRVQADSGTIVLAREERFPNETPCKSVLQQDCHRCTQCAALHGLCHVGCEWLSQAVLTMSIELLMMGQSSSWWDTSAKTLLPSLCWARLMRPKLHARQYTRDRLG